MFAGTALAVAAWLLLHLIGLGIGLAAVDVDDLGSLHRVGIGTTVWSLIAALIAMFLGGMFAGKLSGTYDRKVAGAHGVVVGALTSVLGVATMLWMVAGIAGTAQRVHRDDAPVADNAAFDSATALAAANGRLRAEGRPEMTASEERAATRALARGGHDRDQVADALVANTHLSRADAIDVASQLIDRDTATTADAQKVADTTGRALAAVGITLLLGIAASILGGVLALHDWKRKPHHGGGHHHGGWLRRFSRHTTEPGPGPHQTAPYPPPTVPPTPPEYGG